MTMTRSKVRTAVFALAATFALARPGNSTTVRQLAIGEMVQAAYRIVVGQVTKVESAEDEHGAPVTYVTFSVSDTLKGKPADKLTIKQLGWNDVPEGGGRILRIPGLPRYREGEESVLFLHQPSRGGFSSPIGLEQGKLPVVEIRGQRMVRVRSEDKGRTGWRQWGPAATKGQGKTESMELGDFVGMLRAMVRSVP